MNDDDLYMQRFVEVYDGEAFARTLDGVRKTFEHLHYSGEVMGAFYAVVGNVLVPARVAATQGVADEDDWLHGELVITAGDDIWRIGYRLDGRA